MERIVHFTRTGIPQRFAHSYASPPHHAAPAATTKRTIHQLLRRSLTAKGGHWDSCPRLRSTVCSLQSNPVIHHFPIPIDGADLSRCCQGVEQWNKKLRRQINQAPQAAIRYPSHPRIGNQCLDLVCWGQAALVLLQPLGRAIHGLPPVGSWLPSAVVPSFPRQPSGVLSDATGSDHPRRRHTSSPRL
jgi:hypothetical protein